MILNKFLFYYKFVEFETNAYLFCRQFFFFICIVVQSLSRVQLFATPWIVALHASLSFAVSWGLLKLMSIESLMPSNHFILCCPLLFLSLIFLSIRIFLSSVHFNYFLILSSLSLFPLEFCLYLVLNSFFGSEILLSFL